MKTIRRRHALHEEARHQLVPIMRRANLRGGYVSALGSKRTFHNARLAVHFIPKVDISERSAAKLKADIIRLTRPSIAIPCSPLVLT